MNNKSEILMYKTNDGSTKVEVTYEGEILWLNAQQMAELFDRDSKTIRKHIKNVFDDEKLDKYAVVAKFATTASDGKMYQIEYYNM